MFVLSFFGIHSIIVLSSQEHKTKPWMVSFGFSCWFCLVMNLIFIIFFSSWSLAGSMKHPNDDSNNDLSTGAPKKGVCVCVCFSSFPFFFAFKFHTTGMFLSIWWLGKSQRTADKLSSCSSILGKTNGSCFSPLVGFCSRTNMTNFFSSSTWWP